MKCLRVIQRHHVHSCSSTSITRRNASSRHGKPYELTRLVVDLDAADNTRVRPIKDIPVEEWKGVERFHNNIVKFLEIEQSKRARLENRRQLRRYLAFNALIVTPPDLIQLALFGDPYKQGPEIPITTGYLRGISTYLDLHKKDPQRLKMWSFINELPVDGEAAVKKAGFGVSEEADEAIIERMKDKPFFKRLQRVMSILSQTERGCQFLVSHMKDVKFILEHSTRYTKNYPIILLTLNNLVASIHSKGLEIGPYLCNMGLYFASRLNSHLAIRKYLDIAIRNSYRPNYQIRKAILRLAVPKVPLATPKLWVKGDEYVKQDILTLLTGWESNGVPSSINEEQQPCFSMLAHQNYSSRPLYLGYIQALGEIGATEALWREFNLAQSLSTRLPSSVMINTHRLYEAFITTFLIARDITSALEVTEQAEAAGINLFNTAIDIDQQQSPLHSGPTTPEDPIIPSLLFVHLSIRGRRRVLGHEYERVSDKRESLLNPIDSTVLNDIEKISDLRQKVYAIETLLRDSEGVER